MALVLTRGSIEIYLIPMTTLRPELLMPAGSLDKLRVALSYGADAVYAGVPFFSLRARENEFNEEALQTGISEARAMGKKLYLTANIFARNLKLKSFQENLSRWAALKPDALIMSDPGLIMMARESFPEIPIHLSVQANCMNWQAVKFWQKLGVTRIILSRELRLEEVKEIRQRVPDIELEAFVHGSVCIAYSGRCLMSHYMSYRDANQGVCDNSCRYSFKVFSNQPGSEGQQPDFYLKDMRHPDSEALYRIDEDEHGTHLMNAKDLCLVEHLKELHEAGICSFKVEGRTKSIYYAAMISRIYKQAIDDMMAGKKFDPSLKMELQKLSNRDYFTGFMVGTQTSDSINYDPGVRGHQSLFVGITTEASSADGTVGFEAKGQMSIGEEIEVITPERSYFAKIKNLIKPNGEVCDKVHPGFGLCRVQLSEKVPSMAMLSRRQDA